MARCETCGNEYARTFEVALEGRTHTFDSFECAIFELAPRCDNCGVMVVGHGVDAADKTYCCANCARVKRGESVETRA